MDNPGNFGDCMKGRIRFMTAITPACAHAYRSICLTRHILVVLFLILRLPASQARYPLSPMFVPQHFERSNGFQGWASHTDGALGLLMVKH